MFLLLVLTLPPGAARTAGVAPVPGHPWKEFKAMSASCKAQFLKIVLVQKATLAAVSRRRQEAMVG